MFKICTPISHLFKDKKFGTYALKYSNSLEAREHFENLNKFFSKNIELFHFDIDLNLSWSENIRKEIYTKIKSKKKLKLVTFQMGKNCNKAILANGVFKCISKNLSEKKMLKNVKKNVIWLKGTFKKIKFGVENNNYLKSNAYKIITDPIFISKVVNSSNIFFLLDIAHAQISSFYYKVSFENYLSKLPMDKAIQIHLCRPIIGENFAFDKHYLPTDLDIDRSINILNKFKKIKYLTVEYYRDKNKLINCLKKINSCQKRNV